MKKKISFMLAFVLAFSCCFGLFASAAGVDNFTDVPANAWYREELRYALDKGMVSGTSATTFSGNDKMTRAQFITILGRAMHTEGSTGTKFSDVPTNQYYTPYVYWGVDNGIISGTSDTTFSPNTVLTREQMVVILNRAMFSLNLDVPAVRTVYEPMSFVDNSEIAMYARAAASDCWNKGLINGDSSNRFRPKDGVSRAEGTAVLVRFIQKIEDQIPEAPVETETPAEPETPETPEDPEEPTSSKCYTVTLMGQDYTIGMSEAQVLAMAGKPDEKLASFQSGTWYVYGTDTYEDFFMLGMNGDRLSAICSFGLAFEYCGLRWGDSTENLDYEKWAAETAEAGLYDHRLTGILIYDEYWSGNVPQNCNVDQNTLHDESQAVMHMTNGYRVGCGLEPARWNETLTTAASNHALDMATRDYAAHDTPEGVTAKERVTSLGYEGSFKGENIAAGTTQCKSFRSVRGWILSDGHRKNLLNERTNEIGVGYAYNPDSLYEIYVVQDFGCDTPFVYVY